MIATFKFITPRIRFTKKHPDGQHYNQEATQKINLPPDILKSENGRMRSRSEIMTVLNGMQNDLGASSFTLDI